MLVTVMSVSISMHCLCMSVFFSAILLANVFFSLSTNALVAMELSRIKSLAHMSRKNRTLITTLFSSIEWKQIVAAGVETNIKKAEEIDTRMCDVYTSHYKPYAKKTHNNEQLAFGSFFRRLLSLVDFVLASAHRTWM